MATKPTPVRLGPEIIAQLNRVAKSMGTNKAAFMRLSAKTFADYFEQNGGVASLPPNWREIMASLDGRTRASNVVHLQGGKIVGGVTQNSGRYDSDEDSVISAKAAEKEKKSKRKK